MIRIAVVVLLLTAPYGCDKTNQDSQSGMQGTAQTQLNVSADKKSAQHKSAHVAFKKALDAFNKHDASDLARYFSPDATLILTDSTQEPIRGNQAIKNYFGRLMLVFPDVHIENQRVLDAGDYIVAQVVLSGTQLGEFMGREVSSKRISVPVAMFAKTDAGKIKEAFLCGNPLTVLNQIEGTQKAAVLPPPSPASQRVLRSPGFAHNVRLIQDFFEIFDTGDLARLSALVDKKVVVQAFGDGKTVTGLDTMRRTLVAERVAFEGRIEVEKAFGVGSYVAALVRVYGTLKSDVGPLKATGKSFAERGIDIFSIKDGKIVSWDNYRNLMDLMRQLGIYPPKASGSRR